MPARGTRSLQCKGPPRELFPTLDDHAPLLRLQSGRLFHSAVQISQPLAPLVDEFAQRLFRELDYDQEGRNAELFQQLYGDVPRVGVQHVSHANLHLPSQHSHIAACSYTARTRL